MIRKTLFPILVLLIGAGASAQTPSDNACISRRNDKDQKSAQVVQAFEAEAGGTFSPSNWKTETGMKIVIPDTTNKPFVARITALSEDQLKIVAVALSFGKKTLEQIEELDLKLARIVVSTGLEFNAELCLQQDKKIFLSLVGTGMMKGRSAKIYVRKDSTGILLNGTLSEKDIPEQKAVREKK